MSEVPIDPTSAPILPQSEGGALAQRRPVNPWVAALLMGVTAGVVAAVAGVFLIEGIDFKGLPVTIKWADAQQWFLLAVAGAFGGLLYGVREKKLLRPRRVVDGFEPGYLTDCAYGVAGGFVVFLMIPGNYNLSVQSEAIKMFSTALVGGYGGRALIDRMLGQILEKAEKAVQQAEKAEIKATMVADQATKAAEKAQIVEEKVKASEDQAVNDARALSLVYQQLQDDDSSVKVKESDLVAAIAAASPSTQLHIYNLAREQRKANWRKPETKPKMELAIPVLRALCQADVAEEHPEFRGQLGFALKDQRAPDYVGAERALSEAIRLRGSWRDRGWLFYEYNRAVCRIELEGNWNQGKPSEPGVVTAIRADLEAAWNASFIRPIIVNEEPTKTWLKVNGVELR